jgi:hypothetical protein
MKSNSNITSSLNLKIWMQNPAFSDSQEAEEGNYETPEEIEVEASISFSAYKGTEAFFSNVQEQWDPGDPSEVTITSIRLFNLDEDITHLVSSYEMNRIEQEIFSQIFTL